MDLLDKQFDIKSDTNNRVESMMNNDTSAAISTQPFMESILNTNDGAIQSKERDVGTEIVLEY